MIKKLPCRVCGKPIELSEKYGGRAKSAVHAECARNESKAKTSWNELFWGVINRLMKLISSSAKPLLAGSAGFGAAWGFFEYGSILGMIGGAITFPCLLCGLFTVPAAFVWIAWGTWDAFKSLISWLDRVLDAPETNEKQVSNTKPVHDSWYEEMLAYVTDEHDIWALKRALQNEGAARTLSAHWHLMSLHSRYKKIKGIE